MSATFEVESAIQQALAKPSMRDVIPSVKAAVTEELLAVDPQVSVAHTDYFNHSYVPDMILSWPPAVRRAPRYLYLRYNAKSPELADDVERLEDGEPVFFGLDTTQSREALPSATVDAIERHDDTLVTEATALAQFATSTEAPSLLDAIDRAIIQAGRGPLGQVEAATLHSLTSEALGGPGGIGSTNLAVVTAAVEGIEDAFQPAAARGLLRYMRLVWMIAGGDPLAFPRADEAGGLASKDVERLLRYLFASTEVDDDAFWARLADHVGWATIYALGDQPPSPNLHRLIRAASDHLAGRVVGVQRWLGELSKPLSWRIARGFLTLASGNDLELRIDKDGQRFARAATDNEGVPGPTTEELLSRLRNRPLLAVTTERGALRFGARTVAPLLEADELNQVIAQLGTLGRVQQAEMESASIRILFDFARRRLRADAPLFLDRLLELAGSVLVGLSDDDLRLLSSFAKNHTYTPQVIEPGDLPSQPSLLDGL